MPFDSLGIYIPDVHPYESLIKNLSYDDKWMSSLKNSTLQDRLAPIRPLKPAHWIDTQEALAQASIEIGQTDILAVDLENHSFHSYYGFTCLLQLSTRTEDYLVDVIRLRPWIGAHLGPIFASPDILKVLHGAQSDIAWLQRDFNIFIVNLFDTYFAAKALKLPGLSLAYLLATFCQVTVDKQYQLADWRTRPLPEAMATYAQMDTHYLIALFAALVTKIPDADLKGVFVQSSLSALALYRPEVFNVNGWTSLVDRNASLGNLEKKRLQVLYCWREDVARMEDESPPAVLSAAMMKRLASMNPDLVVGHLKGGKIPLPAAVKHAESLVAALKEGSYTFQNTKLETPVKPAEEAPMVVNLQPVKTPVNPVVVNKVATTTTTPPSSRGRISFVKATPTTAVTLPQKQADSVSTEDAKAVAQSMTIVQVTKMAQAAMEQTPEPTFQTVTKEEDSSPAVTPTPLPDQLISLSRKKPLEIDEKELLASSNSNKITMHDPKRRKQKSTSDDIFINFEAAADRYAHPASKESSAQPAHKKDKPAKTKKPQSEKDSGSFKLGSAPKQGNRSMTFSQK